METYLEKLLSQIRCKKARPYVEEELRNHIESQIEDNLAAGMSYKQAEKCAVADMGDPIGVGVSLDKIHKPQIAWKLLLAVGFLSALGILVQASMGPDKADLAGFAVSVACGFLIMCVICFVDYTTVAKYAKVLGLGIIGLGFLGISGFFGGIVNGTHGFVGIGMLRVSVVSLLMFYIPVYGAILYKYRNGGFGALLKALVWLVVPVCIAFLRPHMVTSAILLGSMLIELTIAVKKKWFRVPVKRTLILLWSAFLIFPVALLLAMYNLHLLAGYQEARLKAFFAQSGDAFYMTNILRTFTGNLEMFGRSSNDVMGMLQDINSDYIFSYIINSYGSLVGILVIGVLVSLVAGIFLTSVNQKNELGMVMGIGCGMVLLLNIALNLLSSLGLIPPASSFLPFLSMGRSNIVLCYALVGFVMSIHRYKEVYPRHVKIEQIKLGKEFTIRITL